MQSTPAPRSGSCRPSTRVLRLIPGALPILLFALAIAPTRPSFAGNTWDGGGGDNFWGTGANWNDNFSPGTGTTSDLYFAGTTRLTPQNNYTSWDDFRSIFFNSGAGAFTINGNPVDLWVSGGSGKIENNSTNTQTINFDSFSLNGGNYEMNPVSGNLSITSSNIFTNGNQINVYGNQTLSFGASSIIQQGGGLVILGGGTVIYQSAHTYTGQTYINNGILRINSGGSANSSILNIGDTSGSNSATLLLGGNNMSLSSAVNVRSGNTGTMTINASGTNQTLSGTVTLNKNAAVSVGSGNDLTISGGINTNSNTLDKLGSGNLTLTSTSNDANNRYYLGAGTLNVSSQSNLGNRATFGSKLYFDGGALNATGNFTIQGNNGITFGNSGGRIGVASGQTLTIQSYIDDNNTNNDFIKSGGGTLFLDKSGSNDFSNTTIRVYEGTLSTYNPSGLLSSTVQLGDTATSGTFNFTKTDGTVTADKTFNIAAGGGTISVTDNALSLGTGNLTGSGTFTKSGAGTLTLSGAGNTHSGSIVVSAGSLAATAALSSTAYTLSGGNFSTSATNQIADTASITVNTGTFTLGGADTVGNISGTGGTINLGANALTTNATSSTTYSGVISGTGGSLTKNGTGALTLNGTNTFTGGVTLNAGQLNINSSTAIGTGTFTINGGTIDNTSGGAITLTNNNTITWNGDFTFAGSNNLDLNKGTITMVGNRTVTVNNGVLIISGSISNSGGTLTKNGTGTLQLDGTNRSGFTTPNYLINSGTFAFQNGQDLGLAPSTVTLGGNSTLTFLGAGWLAGTRSLVINSGVTGNFNTSTAAETRISGTISGSGNLNKIGTGTLNLDSGGNTYTGSTTLSAGTLLLASQLAIQNSTLVMNGGTLTFNSSVTGNAFTLGGLSASTSGTGYNIALQNNAGTPAAIALTVGSNNATTSYAGILSGAGSLVKSGTGTLTLSASNTYTGNTTISSGILEIGAAGRLGGGAYSGNISNSGTFIYSGTNSQTISGIISGSGALTQNSTATLTLSGANSYTGTTTLNSGTLAIGNTMSIGALTGSGNLSLGSHTLTVSPSSTVSFWGAITGTGGISKTGAFSWTLNGTTANTYSGVTSITEGILYLAKTDGINAISGNITLGDGTSGDILYLSSGNQIADTSILTMVGTVANARGDFRLNGFNETIGGLSGDGLVQVDASAATINSTLTLNVASGLTLSSNATLRNTNTSGPILTLVKTGAGTQTLTNTANSYTGSTTINAGTLSVSTLANGGSNSNIGASTNAASNLVLGGGTLEYTGANVTTDRNFTLTNGTTSTISVTNSGSTLTISGAAAAGNGSLTKAGSGSLTLSGANAYTGATTVNAGTLTLGANSVLADSTAVTVNSGGTLSANSRTDTVSSFTINGGLLTISSGTITASNSSSFTNSGSVGFSGAQSGRLNTNGDLTMGNFNFYFNHTSNLTDNNGLSLGANISVADGTIVNFTNNTTNTGRIELTGNREISVGSGAAMNVNWIVDENGGARALTKSGAGTLTLNSTNTYTGLTTVNAGTLVLGNATDTLNGAVTISGGTLSLGSNNDTVGAVTMTSGSISGTGKLTGTSYALQGGSIGANLGTGTITVTSGTTTLSGTADSTTININSGNLTLGAANRLADTAAVTVNSTFNLGGFNETIGAFTGNSSGAVQLGAGTLTTDSSSSGTFAGVISGSGGLTKAGSGTLTLSGANDYSGATIINAGTISLGSTNNVIGDSSDITIAGGTLTMTTNTETLRSVTMSSGNLTKNGGNTLTISQASTLSGGTVNLTTGTMTFAANSQFTGAQVNIISGASVALNTGSNATFNGSNATFSATTSRMNTSGNFNLGNSTFSYDNGSAAGDGLFMGGDFVVLSGATANFTNAGAGSGRITLNGANRVIDVGSSANMNVGWVIAGSSGNGLTKNGTGTLTLSAANTYTGATAINAGTLVLNGSNTNSAISINSGGTLAGTGSGGGTTVNSGGRISPGGSSIGTLSTTTLTLEGGGGYTFSITNVTGSAGTNWDLINVGSGSGSVAINATSGNKFTIYLNGTPTGWSDSGTYAWNIISSSNVTGFATDDFAFDVTGFNGGSTPAGSFYMSNSGSALVLNYAILGDAVWSGGTGDWSGGFTPPVSTNVNVFFTGATGGTATNNIGSGTLSSLQSITFNSTAGAYTLAANSGSAGASGGTALSVTGSIVNNSSANQTINLDLAFAADRVVNTASGNIAIGGVISGAGGLTKNGSSTLTLSASNTFTGAVLINNGTLATTGSGGFANGANVTVASGATYNVGVSDQINSLSSPGSLVLSAGTLTICGTASSTISGAISGSGNLTKGGAGTLTITNNNSGYSGITRLDGGVLEIGNDGALGTGNLIVGASGVTIRSTDATDRTIANRFGTFAGSTAVYTFGSSGTGNLTFTNTQSADLGAVRTFSINNSITRFDGNFTGTGAGITKNGTGMMILNGASSYTGATTVNSGILRAGNSTALGTTAGGVTVASGAALELTGGINIGAEALSLTGSGISNGGALRNISGANSYDGAVTLAGATTINSDAGTLTLTGGLTGTNTNLMIGGAGATTISTSGISIGTGTLTKNDAGTLTLNTANTYSGATTINAGTLNAANANALGTNASVTVNGGSLLVSADDAINGRAITLASTSTTVAGLAFSGTFANTSGQAGTLTLSQNSILDLGTGSVVLHFSSITGLDTYTLAIYNWTGTTLWGGGDGNNTDQFYSNGTALTQSQLNRISFYSGGLGTSSFIGSGYQIIGGSFANEVIPVPEPETYATAVLLLLGGGLWIWRNRRSQALSEFGTLARKRAKTLPPRSFSWGWGAAVVHNPPRR